MQLRRFGRVVISAIVALLLTACAGTPHKESSGEYIDDSVLTTKVKTALVNDPMVSGLAVKVDTFKGVVQLSGFVSSAAQRDRAGKLAGQVNGVKQVKNDILIR